MIEGVLQRFEEPGLSGIKRAFEAAKSGLFETLQYPFNHLASESELDLVKLCEDRGMGFIAMKALSGGLITDAAAPFAYIAQFPQVVPIWGIQRMEELEQFIALDADPPVLDDAMRARVEADRAELSGAFCRGCGYCLPCPADIPIHQANRMTQLLTRSPSAGWLTEEWRNNMNRVALCQKCGLCAARCPFGLRPQETLPGHYEFYRQYAAENT